MSGPDRRKWFDTSDEREQFDHLLSGGGGLVAVIVLGVLGIIAVVIGVVS